MGCFSCSGPWDMLADMSIIVRLKSLEQDNLIITAMKTYIQCYYTAYVVLHRYISLSLTNISQQ
jgi:hypothetical protein